MTSVQLSPSIEVLKSVAATINKVSGQTSKVSSVLWLSSCDCLFSISCLRDVQAIPVVIGGLGTKAGTQTMLIPQSE